MLNLHRAASSGEENSCQKVTIRRSNAAVWVEVGEKSGSLLLLVLFYHEM